MKQNNHNLGFSLIEIIAVIFIISIGLIGVLSLVTQNIQVKNFNEDVLVASQLAQEGLELTRNIRDENWVEVEWFGNGLVIEGGSNTITIYFDGVDVSITSVTDINSELAKLKKDNGFYIHGEGEETIFSRVIEINNTDINSFTVSSIVQWSSRGKTHQYQADTILYDWR